MLKWLLRRRETNDIYPSQRMLKRWLAQLPMLDLPKCLVQIDNLLFQWKMVAKVDKTWQGRLSQLFMTMQEVSHHATAKYVNDRVDSDEAKRALLHFTRNVHLQIANQSHHLAHASDVTDTGEYRALALFSYAMVILRSYQLLVPPPKGAWQKIYQNFLGISELTHLPASYVSKQSYYPAKSALHPFYAIIVIATCDPFRQSPENLDELFKAMLKNTDDHHLVMQQAGQGYRFGFLTYEDKAPRLASMMGETDSSQAYFIDLSSLDESLSGLGCSPQLVERLKTVWQKSYERRHERFKSQGEAQIIAGLYRCYQYLNNDQTERNRLMHQPGLNFRYADTQNPYWQNIIDSYQRSLEADSMSSSVLWHVHNQSENGVSVTSHTSLPLAHMSIGQFVHVSNMVTHQTLGALIRWVNIDESGIAALGLEYLGKENVALRLQSEQQRQQNRSAFGIMSKYAKKPWPTRVLVSQKVGYQAGDILYLISGQHHLKVVLTASLEETEHCQLFSFEVTQ